MHHVRPHPLNVVNVDFNQSPTDKRRKTYWHLGWGIAIASFEETLAKYF